MTDVNAGIFLKDVVDHTSSLEGIDLVKFANVDNEATAFAGTKNAGVIVHIKGLHPVADLPEKGGIAGLPAFKAILNYTDMEHDDVAIRLVPQPVGKDAECLQVIKENGIFLQHQLYNRDAIDGALKTGKANVPEWFVTSDVPESSIPVLSDIAKLTTDPLCKFESQEGETEMYCSVSGALTHLDTGVFKFLNDADGIYNVGDEPSFYFPVPKLLTILETSGDKVMSFGTGVLRIVVTSEIAEYTYFLLGLSK